LSNQILHIFLGTPTNCKNLRYEFVQRKNDEVHYFLCHCNVLLITVFSYLALGVGLGEGVAVVSVLSPVSFFTQAHPFKNRDAATAATTLPAQFLRCRLACQ
jgi:hypothetical protein